MSRRSKFILAAAVLASIAGLAGCGRESTTAPDEDGGITVIWPEPFIVTDADSLRFVTVTDSMLVFDVLAGSPRIATGQVIVGTEDGGYVRRIVSSEIRGSRLSIRTAPATLVDAVMFGAIDTVMEIGFGSSTERSYEEGSDARRDRAGLARAETSPADLIKLAPGVSISGGGINLSGTVLYSGEVDGKRLTVTIPRGRVEFNPTLSRAMRMRGNRMAEYRVVASGRLALTFDVTVESADSISFNHETQIASLSRQVVQRIGGVPVVETITISYVAGFKIRKGLIGACTVGTDGASDVELGAVYRNHAWAPVGGAGMQFDPHPIVYNSPSEAEFEVYVRPRLDIELYDAPCCDLSWTACLHLSERDIGFPVLGWEFLGGFDVRCRIEPGNIDRRVIEYDPDLFGQVAILAAGPFRTDDYVFIKEWVGERSGDGQFAYPKGIAVDDADNIYVVDNWNSRIQKFTSDGRFLMKWGTNGSGAGQFSSPEGIALDESGNIYVVDGGNNRIQKFAPDSTFIAAWGSEGSGEGQFRSPVGIAVYGGNVFVTDNLNARVQRFSIDGDFRGAWGSPGGGDGQFESPMGVAVNPLDQGQIFVTDCHGNRVQAFTPNGQLVNAWGSFGTGDYEFDCPVNAAFGAGALWITDTGNDRIMKYELSGSFVTKLGTSGTGEGQFDHPEGIAIDGQGNLYVVDARNRRIQKFAPRTN